MIICACSSSLKLLCGFNLVIEEKNNPDSWSTYLEASKIHTRALMKNLKPCGEKEHACKDAGREAPIQG